MAETVDVAILGGGCAGLSLAHHLSRRGGSRLRVAVVEQRENYVRDRTWCSWSVTPHAFSHCVDHRWSRWSARSGGQQWTQSSDRYAYEHIRADRFYDAALQAIEDADGFELLTGARVLEVEPGTPSRVLTSAGTLSAGLVVDTRPGQHGAQGGTLLQHFEGWELRTERPVFDPQTATLMDFDVDQTGGAHFMYVLPFGRDHALVESTVLSPEPFPAEVYGRRIEAYLSDRFGTTARRVDFRERGVIPMGDGLRKDSGLAAGTAGGAVKPSSGYAFHAIQSTTETLADGIVAGDAQPVPARGGLDRWMDRVFLSFLRRNPGRAPELFARMFAGTDGDTLARFMMERPGLVDRLRVIRSMPTMGFAREALRVRAS